MSNIDIKKVTLQTKVYHYYYNTVQIMEITDSYLKVACKCKFSGNVFYLRFVNDQNTSDYTKDGCRHISELSLSPITPLA